MLSQKVRDLLLIGGAVAVIISAACIVINVGNAVVVCGDLPATIETGTK